MNEKLNKRKFRIVSMLSGFFFPSTPDFVVPDFISKTVV